MTTKNQDLKTLREVAEREEVADIIGYHLAALVSGNNMPDMSGDPRNRLHAHIRRRFDGACEEAANAILLLAAEQRGEAEREREQTAAVLERWAEKLQDICERLGCEPGSSRFDFIDDNLARIDSAQQEAERLRGALREIEGACGLPGMTTAEGGLKRVYRIARQALNTTEREADHER